MKSPLKAGLISGLVAMVVASCVEMALAKAENDFFQFCTTKAYGWPAPWRIDYCECEGGKTTWPTASKLVNLSVIAGSGAVAFGVFGVVARLRDGRKQT